MLNKFYTILAIFLIAVFAGMFFSIKAKDAEIARIQIEIK